MDALFARFEGATGAGVKFIDTWTCERSRRVRAELAEAALSNGEPIISCSTCAPATFARQWQHFSRHRAAVAVNKRDELIYIAGIFAVGIAVILAIGWSAPWLVPRSASEILSAVCKIGTMVLLGVAAVVWGAFFRRYMISRRLGFADLFAARNALALKAWATSETAVYVRECYPRPRLPCVRRIPLSDIEDVLVEPSAIGSRVSLIEIAGRREHIYDPTGLDLSVLRSIRSSDTEEGNSVQAGLKLGAL